jgi:hypothetical protein
MTTHFDAGYSPANYKRRQIPAGSGLHGSGERATIMKSAHLWRIFLWILPTAQISAIVVFPQCPGNVVGSETTDAKDSLGGLRVYIIQRF